MPQVGRWYVSNQHLTACACEPRLLRALYVSGEKGTIFQCLWCGKTRRIEHQLYSYMAPAGKDSILESIAELFRELDPTKRRIQKLADVLAEVIAA